MGETGGWMLLLLAVLLLAAGAVRFDLWSAWLHERLAPLLHRIKHH